MDKNAREDASGWETKGQKSNLSFGVGCRTTI